MVSRGFPVLAGALALLAAGTAAAQQPATSAAGIDAATPTAADFGALPFLTQPLLSPDGKQLLAIGQFGGKKMVLVINVDDPKTGMVRFAAPDKNQIEWVRWAGSRRILASLSRADSLMGEDVRVTRLMMADLDTHKQTLVGPQEQGVEGDNIVHVDPAGKFLLLNTQPSIYDWPEVYRVDLDTGRSKRVVEAQEGVWNWYADRAGVVRVGIGIDGNRSWVTYRSDEKEPFKRVLKHDARNDTVSDDEDIYQFEPVPGSDGGYAMAFGKTGHFALYRYDFGALKRGELLYENPEVDIDDFSVASDGSLRAIYYTDDRSEIAWFDPEMKKLQGAIDRAVPGKINRIVSTSEDRNRMLIWSGSANDPGAYYLFDRASKHLGILATPYASLEGKRLSTVQPVRYKARDGLEIRAYLTLPPGKETAQGLPLVVMPHGGPFARDEGDYDDWVQFVASRGYVVLQPNFRGSTGFGKAFVDKGNGQWGRGMQDDIDDGVKWLASTGRIDARRVCIMGGSFGGYAAEWAAIRNPELYRCAISFAGVSDVAAQLRYSHKSFVADRYYRNWRTIVRGEESFDLASISPLQQASRVAIPLLIAHGTDDDRVPPNQSRKLHEALTKAGKPHEYYTYEGEGHGFDKAEHSTDFLNRVEAFLKKYNPS